MKQQGKIIRWQDDKGFGFIQTQNQQEIFFHIRDYRANTRPTLNEKVLFDIGMDKKNRPCAKNIQQAEFVQQKIAERNAKHNAYLQRQQAREISENTLSSVVIFGLGFLVLLSIVSLMLKLSWLILGWYIMLGLITFAMYAKDKSSAKNNGWRTPENTLHTLAIVGGWVGASLAHKILKHKSSKTSFRQIFYATIIINMILLVIIVRKL